MPESPKIIIGQSVDLRKFACIIDDSQIRVYEIFGEDETPPPEAVKIASEVFDGAIAAVKNCPPGDVDTRQLGDDLTGIVLAIVKIENAEDAAIEAAENAENNLRILTYDLDPEVITNYHGCGRGWAAVLRSKVKAIRYAGDAPAIDISQLPQWIQAIAAACESIDDNGLPEAHSRAEYIKLAEAASAAEDCPKPENKPRYRPEELLRQARAAMRAMQKLAVTEWENQCHAELATIGKIHAGMIGSWQFTITDQGY